MTRLELTGIPEHLVRRLEAAARVHGRDVATEAAAMIERGLEAAERVERELAGVRALRQRMPKAWITDEMIRESRDEGRA
jgi:hypothetical protein